MVGDGGLTRREALLGLGGAALATRVGAKDRSRRLYATCGGPAVRIREAETHAVLWEWDADSDANVPDAWKASFKTTADCKWIDGGASLLIVSSHDGVAIVDKVSGRASFIAQVGHAHSADVTPGGAILVAGSDGERGGDVLALYDRRDGSRRISQTPLDSAHGVVFDRRRMAFWALGRSELRLVAAQPHLSTLWSAPLPTLGGHDLVRTSAATLAVTTDTNVYSFDLVRRRFSAFPMLHDTAGVKSIDVGPDGQIMFVRADDPANGIWWTERLRFANPDGEAELGERLYKARWLQKANSGSLGLVGSKRPN